MNTKRSIGFGVALLNAFFMAFACGASSPVQVTVPATNSPPELPGLGLHLLPDAAPNPDLFVFASYSSKLVPNDTNGFSDVFVWSRSTGEIRLVSGGMNGESANGASYDPAISKDGRYVVFVSTASNLIPNDTNKIEDVFVKDLQTGTLELISPSTKSAGMYLGDTRNPVISDEGRYVAFVSAYFYIRDRPSGTNLWASWYFSTNRTFYVSNPQPLGFVGSNLWVQGDTNLWKFNLKTSEWSLIAPSTTRPALSPDNSMMALQVATTNTNVVSRFILANEQLITVVATSNSFTKYKGLSISDNGSIAFLADAQLVSEDTNTNLDLYVTPPLNGTGPITLASSPSVAAGVVRTISNPTVSPNGAHVYYRQFTIAANGQRTGETVVRDLATSSTTAIAPTWPHDNLSRIVTTPSGIYLASESNQFDLPTASTENDLVFLSATNDSVDSDNDGLPDWWEMMMFGSLAQGPADDPDGDGMSNLAEYLAGSDPNSADSSLRLEISSQSGVRHLIYSRTTRRVAVQYRDAADAGAWSDLQTKSTEADGRPSFLDSDLRAERIYRIELLP